MNSNGFVNNYRKHMGGHKPSPSDNQLRVDTRSKTVIGAVVPRRIYYPIHTLLSRNSMQAMADWHIATGTPVTVTNGH